jgi:signal transduction histidine kinase
LDTGGNGGRGADVSGELIRSAFENAPDGVLIADASGRVVVANRAAALLLGCSPDVLVGTPLAARVLEASAARIECRRSVVRGAGGTFEAAFLRDRALPRGPDHEAARLEALGRAARGVAHDFNNLLQIIVANVTSARVDAPASSELADCLDDAALAAMRASDLVRQILSFGGPSCPARTPLAGIVTEVARLLRSRTRETVRVETELGHDLPAVHVDAARVHRILMNLGTNAEDAVDPGPGTITLGLSALSVEDGTRGLPGLAPGRYARLRVSDDGRGMDAGTVRRVFDPLFTTKATPSGGLGLSVVREIVADHGGIVTVESVQGEGTTFSVYLPAAPEGSRIG